jgi:DNA-binding PadR family transcriptional regulator
MYKSNPKYRKKLNDEQVAVLELLWKFRFGSSELIAKYFGKKQGTDVYRRLRVLEDQGFIGRRYEPSYKLQGKPAAYYLMPTGARFLQEVRGSDDTEAINIKNIYKDKTVSETFANHCLEIFAIYNQLKAEYGDKLRFFTKSDFATFDYFPRPLPDVYIQLASKEGERQFFLDLYDDKQPLFVAARKFKQYAVYADGGQWDTAETQPPTFLAVCESVGLQKRLQKQAVFVLSQAQDDNLVFALTTSAALKADGKGSIWQLASEPDVTLPLDHLA